MDLTTLFIIGAALVAIVTAVVEVVKKTVKLPKRYVPITSTVVGIFVAVIVWPLTDYDVYTMAVAGLVAGLASSGTFDIIKALRKE